MFYHDSKGHKKTVLELADNHRRTQENSTQGLENHVQNLKVGGMFVLLTVRNRVNIR